MRRKYLRGGDEQGGEAHIEKYLQDGAVNEGQKLTPGWKLRYMKNQFTHNTACTLFFFLNHLSDVSSPV